MATLDNLLAQKETLLAALASPAESVSYDGLGSKKSRSVAELRTALDEVNRQIATLSGTRPIRRVFLGTSKGL
jgi:hypothetical protein